MFEHLVLADKRIDSSKLLYEPNFVDNNLGGVSIRFGDLISFQDRQKEVAEGFESRGMSVPKLGLDLGVRNLYLNREPEAEADMKGIQVVTTAMRYTMDRLG